MKNLLIGFSLILLIVLSHSVYGLSIHDLTTVAETFRAEKLSEHTDSLLSVEPFAPDDIVIGYHARYTPEGYALLRADTHLAPVKLYAEQGSFTSLPPNFVHVMALELSDELTALAEMRARNDLPERDWRMTWERLMNPATAATIVSSAAVTADTYGPLLSTGWNQGSAYNLFCPPAAGGPDGKAWAGCVAAAMAQIMNYHQHPATGTSYRIYRDAFGSCQGWHTGDFASTAYEWSLMPTAIGSGTFQSQIAAVARLMYHAGIAVTMNYEADGSGAYSSDVPGAFRDYFGYDCLGLAGRSSGTAYEPWYTRIKIEISNNRPVYYSFADTTLGLGHAVVVDGCRNGNEIHINMGWGGSGNAWYDLNNIAYGAYTFNSGHDAVFGICRAGELDDRYEPNDQQSSAYLSIF